MPRRSPVLRRTKNATPTRAGSKTSEVVFVRQAKPKSTAIARLARVEKPSRSVRSSSRINALFRHIARLSLVTEALTKMNMGFKLVRAAATNATVGRCGEIS